MPKMLGGVFSAALLASSLMAGQFRGSHAMAGDSPLAEIVSDVMEQLNAIPGVDQYVAELPIDGIATLLDGSAGIPFDFLQTDLQGSMSESLQALQQELAPFVDDALAQAGVNQECLADAYRMVTGCATDFYSVATQARSDVLSRARVNPMVYLQPTSATIIAAAEEVLQDGAELFPMDGSCCAALASLSDQNCLCDANIVTLVSAITGQPFLDTVQESYSELCGGAELHLYPSPTCQL
mmetsp:Transcript_7800/g.19170  ORF Transcript_7800/g.19170 Transcript_7800/m.19170 type:complete len:239 (+) Transcript_7800:266-982(+)